MQPKPALLSRSAFDSADDYAVYVRDRVAIGMRVRCCLGFARNRSKLQNGDTGVVVHLDRNGQLFDRNVEVYQLLRPKAIFLLQLVIGKATFILGQME